MLHALKIRIIMPLNDIFIKHALFGRSPYEITCCRTLWTGSCDCWTKWSSFSLCLRNKCQGNWYVIYAYMTDWVNLSINAVNQPKILAVMHVPTKYLCYACTARNKAFDDGSSFTTINRKQTAFNALSSECLLLGSKRDTCFYVICQFYLSFHTKTSYTSSIEAK